MNCPYCEKELVFRAKHVHLISNNPEEKISAICPRCHKPKVEIEITKGSHIYGLFYWSVIVECKNCKLSVSVPSEGNNIVDIIEEVLEVWNDLK